MKKLLSLLFTACSLAALGQSTGNPPPNPAVNVFSAAPNLTNLNAGLSWAVVTARSGNGGTPAIQYINAGSSNVAANCVFYKITAQTPVTFTNSTVTLFVRETNGFGSAQSEVVVIRHLATDTYDRRVLTANSDTTNLVVTIAPNTTVPGDIVYRCTTNSMIPWANTPITNSLNAAGAPIYVGQQGLPILVEIQGGATGGQMNLVSGTFIPPVRIPPGF